MIDNFYHRLLFAIWLQTLPSVRQMYIINMYCHDAGMTAVILEDFINKLTERERRETEGRRVGMIGFSLLKKKNDLWWEQCSGDLDEYISPARCSKH